VETAVEAMKIGALDYLIKPFDPDVLIPKIVKIYDDFQATKAPVMEVGAIVLAGGSAYFDPSRGKDPFSYGHCPDVVTSLEFERILGSGGPFQGRLIRPSDGKPIEKIVWIQCVGSRDLQTGKGFCSNICCMFAIKEALVAKERAKLQGKDVETVIYYMDMRTFGKTFQRYRDRAENEFGVRFERARIHSVLEDNDRLHLRYVDIAGQIREESSDLVVLSVGQRPAPGAQHLAEMLQLDTNQWGFAGAKPFSMTETAHQGVVLGGSFSGLRDISDTVILSSAAALGTSRILHEHGQDLMVERPETTSYTDVARELPRTLIVICTCQEAVNKMCDVRTLIKALPRDPAVSGVEFISQTCTQTGWDKIVALVKTHHPNRLLLGACLPYIYARKLKQLGQQTGLDPALINVVDIRTILIQSCTHPPKPAEKSVEASMLNTLKAGLAQLKYVNPIHGHGVSVFQRALIVGGGIAGLTSALAIADHGFQVDLVETKDVLGGNLAWIGHTIEGHATGPFLEDTMARVAAHPLIRTLTQAHVTGSYGMVGRFHTTIEQGQNDVINVKHGITILATGGFEAQTTEYGYGTCHAIVTQKQLERQIVEGGINIETLNSVIFIQCVGSREPPRNYCSRICCISTLKHALAMKEKNPDMSVYVFYRDMMSYGFSEEYYTKAREAGVIFILYTLARKPELTILADESNGAVRINAFEPIIGQDIEIDADMAVLATGIVPNLSQDLALAFGVSTDSDGFFQEAESKWRPVDSLKEGVFACGICHSPRSVAESIATAEAAAQRGLRILARKHIPSGSVVANVRHSLCALCERCIDACPYGARTIDDATETIAVNPAMCQGCGNCATVCPNGASFVEGYRFEQMLATIDAACDEERI
jgi:heterodisulfide reductase subunit A